MRGLVRSQPYRSVANLRPPVLHLPLRRQGHATFFVLLVGWPLLMVQAMAASSVHYMAACDEKDVKAGSCESLEPVRRNLGHTGESGNVCTLHEML